VHDFKLALNDKILAVHFSRSDDKSSWIWNFSSGDYEEKIIRVIGEI